MPHAQRARHAPYRPRRVSQVFLSPPIPFKFRACNALLFADKFVHDGCITSSQKVDTGEIS